MPAWSYSSIKTFEQCAKKYYHLKVAKDVKDTGSEATLYGNQLHKAAEEYVKLSKPLPEKFKFILSVLDALNKIPGEKHCELRLAVAYDGKEYTPTTYFAKDVWWRGVADLLIVDGELAYLVDYKTSKNAKYADTTQLDIAAAAVFTHYPQVEKIKSALVFVVSNEFIEKEHHRELYKSYYATFDEPLDRLAAAEKNNVWNAVSGPLCAYCPVKSCEHNRGG
jgi:hypothetical protein